MRHILLAGLGGMGRVHLANYAYLSQKAVVVAVVGKTDADRDFALDKGLDFYTDMADAIASHEEIDTIDITTPSWLHYDNVLQALALGRDVICEKPLALSSAQADAMYNEARGRGLRLVPALVCRYTKEFALLKKTVQEGEYGRLIEIRFTRLSEKPAWSEGSWLLDKSKSGLVPFDLMIHDIDMMVSLLGTSVRLEKVLKGGQNHYHAAYMNGDGCLALIESGWLDAAIPFEAVWKAVFEHAVMVNDGNRVVIYPEGRAPVHLPVVYPVVVSTGINVPPTGWYYEELSNIIDELDGRKEPASSSLEVVHALRLAEDTAG